MSKHVVLVSSAGGNIASVERALQHCGAVVTISNDPAMLAKADSIVLPGVGAFANCLQGLRNDGILAALDSHIAEDKPLLGICVGMQALLSQSLEFGCHQGLNKVDGTVRQIPRLSADHKIPHIGWYPLQQQQTNPLWRQQEDDAYFYFVHSFFADPTDSTVVYASYQYQNLSIPALIGHGNSFGCQFHPEKSGDAGLQLLQNFLTL